MDPENAQPELEEKVSRKFMLRFETNTSIWGRSLMWYFKEFIGYKLFDNFEKPERILILKGKLRGAGMGVKWCTYLLFMLFLVRIGETGSCLRMRFTLYWQVFPKSPCFRGRVLTQQSLWLWRKRLWGSRVKAKTTRHRKLFKGSCLSSSVRLTLLLIYNNSLLKSPNYCTTSSWCHVSLAFLHLN